MSDKIAIYPGTFDPITYGHVDIITRALNTFDELIIAVAENTEKNPLFTQNQRIMMVEEELNRLGLPRAKVFGFRGLLVNFAREKKAVAIIRGLRAVSDFEYEFQMACMNNQLAPEIQTLFMPASEKTHFVSSRLVKEVFRLGANITDFVSEQVKNKLIQKYK